MYTTNGHTSQDICEIMLHNENTEQLPILAAPLRFVVISAVNTAENRLNLVCSETAIAELSAY